jgi:hypothetical protein
MTSHCSPAKSVPPGPSGQPACEAPTRFGGTRAIPDLEVFARARRDNPIWYQVLEEGYKRLAQSPENRGVYPDPEGQGATPEQVWRIFTLFGVETYCVLTRKMPDDQVKGIGRLERRSPEQLVDMLRKLQSVSGEINVTTLHYDGGTGHCIRITAYDPQRDRFIYHDPWPAESLLCQNNNVASVDARREGGRWSVTSMELERVIFASYIFPTQWARLNRVDFDLAYGGWEGSEFYRFFHLKLLDERTENGRKRRSFTAGPFKDNVSVVVECAKNEKIVSSRLVLKQDWAAGNPMLAIDIAKSFLLAFVPSSDQATFGEIGRALWQIKDANFIKALPRELSDDPAIRCVQAFLGGIERADVQTDFGLLSVKNSESEGKKLVELVFSLF